MKFLVDAQLPRRFTGWLAEAGHDALHTLDMPLKNRTSDAEVVARGTPIVSKKLPNKARPAEGVEKRG